MYSTYLLYDLPMRFASLALLILSSHSYISSLKTDACTKPYSSYRSSFVAKCGKWTTVRLPFSAFQAKGPGAESTPFDAGKLRRLGIVAIGKPMKVQLALSGIRFFRDLSA